MRPEGLPQERHQKLSLFLRDFTYGLLCGALMHLLRCQSLEKSRRLGACLARNLGPTLAQHRMGHKNVARVFPCWSFLQRENFLTKNWEEMGRVLAEYLHLDTLMGGQAVPQVRRKYAPLSPHMKVQGAEILRALGQDGRPAIIFSAHLSNFQLILGAALQQDVPLWQFYRPSTNEWINRRIAPLQQRLARGLIPKGLQGMRGLLRALDAGEHIFMLLDQKTHPGQTLPFLGHGAATSMLMAKLCQKYQCPLVPARVFRTPEGVFDVCFYPPLDLHQSAEKLALHINNRISAWIREHPQQWMWVYDRWSPVGPHNAGS